MPSFNIVLLLSSKVNICSRFHLHASCLQVKRSEQKQFKFKRATAARHHKLDESLRSSGPAAGAWQREEDSSFLGD